MTSTHLRPILSLSAPAKIEVTNAPAVHMAVTTSLCVEESGSPPRSSPTATVTLPIIPVSYPAKVRRGFLVVDGTYRTGKSEWDVKSNRTASAHHESCDGCRRADEDDVQSDLRRLAALGGPPLRTFSSPSAITILSSTSTNCLCLLLTSSTCSVLPLKRRLSSSVNLLDIVVSCQ